MSRFIQYGRGFYLNLDDVSRIEWYQGLNGQNDYYVEVVMRYGEKVRVLEHVTSSEKVRKYAESLAHLLAGMSGTINHAAVSSTTWPPVQRAEEME